MNVGSSPPSLRQILASSSETRHLRQAKVAAKATTLPKAADLRLEVKISLEKALRGAFRSLVIHLLDH